MKQGTDKAAQTLKNMFGAEEVEEVQGQSIVLDVYDGVRGIYKGIEDGVDNKGREIKIVILQTKLRLVNMAMPTMLQGLIDNVEIGTEVGIIRLEDQITKDKKNKFKTFSLYKVIAKPKKAK